MEQGFERRLVRLVVSLLCLVAVIQGLLRFDEVRALLNESIRLEGEPLAQVVAGLGEPATPYLELDSVWADEDGSETQGMVFLRLLAKPKGEVWALVNGRAVKQITQDDGAISCKQGDLIEVLWEKGEGNVLVSAVSDNVSFPSVGTWVKGQGILLIGRVKIR